jgi:hypothetical protein
MIPADHDAGALITSAGRFSPLGPRGIIFLLFLCGVVLGFRGKFVENRAYIHLPRTLGAGPEW